MNKENTYFNAMRETVEAHRRDSTKPFPYTQGACKAYRAWAASVSRGNEEPELDDFLWEREVSDFVDTLRKARIESFTITDRSTALMGNLHALAAEGCTMEGLCTVGRIEPEWGYSMPKDVMGIRFKVN